MERAHQVRDKITNLGWDKHFLILEDVAVVVRTLDGLFTLGREPFPASSNVLGCTAVGFLAGLVLGAPLAGAAVGAIARGVGTPVTHAVGIGDDFVREVEVLMKPGTSALFVPDSEGDMGRDPACDPRPGRDGVEDQRGPGAGEADPVHFGRASGTSEQTRRRVNREGVHGMA
jgi:hypothetical protein